MSAADERAAVGTVAVLFLDLDGFKGVNDAPATRSATSCWGWSRSGSAERRTDDDVVARLGGDEFGVLVIADEVDGEAIWVADRVTRVLDSEFRVGGRQLLRRGQRRHRDQRRAATRTRTVAAQRGPRDVPREGRSRQCRSCASRRTCTTTSLERVTSRGRPASRRTRGELELHYQPVVDLAHAARCRRRGAAALAAPGRAASSRPASSSALAEETGLVGEIGRVGTQRGVPYGDPLAAVRARSGDVFTRGRQRLGRTSWACARRISVDGRAERLGPARAGV